MDRLNLEVRAGHPWFTFIASEENRQQAQASLLRDGSILVSVRIAGMEEFYYLDSVWETTSVDRREQVFQTEWRRMSHR